MPQCCMSLTGGGVKNVDAAAGQLAQHGGNKVGKGSGHGDEVVVDRNTSGALIVESVVEKAKHLQFLGAVASQGFANNVVRKGHQGVCVCPRAVRDGGSEPGQVGEGVLVSINSSLDRHDGGKYRVSGLVLDRTVLVHVPERVRQRSHNSNHASAGHSLVGVKRPAGTGKNAVC